MGCALLRAGLEVRNRARGSQQQLDAQSVRLKLVADRANTFHSVQAILAYSDSAMPARVDRRAVMVCATSSR